MKLKRPNGWQAIQAGVCLLCAFLSLEITDGLDGTEFSGGWLTGPLLKMANVGMVLFILALVATFFFPKISAAIGLAAAFLCLPIYCFFIAPVPFARIFARGHEFSVPPPPGLHWHVWPVAALFAAAATIYLCLRRLTPGGDKRIR